MVVWAWYQISVVQTRHIDIYISSSTWRLNISLGEDVHSWWTSSSEETEWRFRSVNAPARNCHTFWTGWFCLQLCCLPVLMLLSSDFMIIVELLARCIVFATGAPLLCFAHNLTTKWRTRRFKHGVHILFFDFATLKNMLLCGVPMCSLQGHRHVLPNNGAFRPICQHQHLRTSS